MQIFACRNCGQLVHFENHVCGTCGHGLGYRPESRTLETLTGAEGRLETLADAPVAVRRCANYEPIACNWLVPADEPEPYCLACRLNRTIPDLSVPGNAERWRKLETAKRRLVYSLIALGAPIAAKADEPASGLAFDFLADTPAPGGKVMTGHDDGVVTINIAEADDAERERVRATLSEVYRTLLGHFRHEVGHYYWDRLVSDGGKLDAFRAVFGDERSDYGKALAAHYRAGPPADWTEHFVSPYASAHPWEDFAETFAHYLHIVDTLETAYAFSLKIRPRAGEGASLSAAIDLDPYRAAAFGPIVAAWVPLTVAVNSLNRSMGVPDLYPFVLAPAAVAKLGFVHGLFHDPVPG